MKILQGVYFFILLLALISCKKEDTSTLKGCCDVPLINETFGVTGSAHVYVPNVFTPNDDGINDDLIVNGDSVQIIIFFEIRNADNELVFHVGNIEVNDTANGWDGKVNGSVQKGLYDVSLEVMADDGTIADFTGKVCNYPCGYGDEGDMVPAAHCQFPVQVTDGLFDPTIPPGESPNCYK